MNKKEYREYLLEVIALDNEDIIASVSNPSSEDILPEGDEYNVD